MALPTTLIAIIAKLGGETIGTLMHILCWVFSSFNVCARPCFKRFLVKKSLCIGTFYYMTRFRSYLPLRYFHVQTPTSTTACPDYHTQPSKSTELRAIFGAFIIMSHWCEDSSQWTRAHSDYLTNSHTWDLRAFYLRYNRYENERIQCTYEGVDII